MTAEDVAAYLRLTPATIYRLARSGQLPGAKIGRVWRFRKDIVDQLFHEGELVKVKKTGQET